MKQLIAQSMKTYFQSRALQLRFWTNNSVINQEFLLFNLLDTAKNTVFGQQYDFENIQSYTQFSHSIPVSQYEDIEPFIIRMMAGETDVLWPGKIANFSQSSGTTNDISKYIPVSHASLYNNNYKAGRDIYTIFFQNYPDSQLFENNGSVFSLGGSLKKNEHSICIGDVSAIIMSELPKWAQKYREPSLETALIKDWKEKIPKMIEETRDKNITQLSGVPTWFVSIFEELRKETSFSTLRDIWPNLELFVHGAVSFAPYQKIFQELLPFEDMKYLEVYNASEGFFAIQDDPEKQGEMLLLTNHGIFYEFIAMSDYQQKRYTTISLADVECGVDYAMIITTNAGLWRYDIGDTVCFTSIDPYRIKISGRTKHFINVFGEELMVGNSDEAIAIISEEMDVQIEQYTAAPVYMNEKNSQGGHEWIIEFAKEPRDVQKFAKRLDEILQSLNSDYAAKRQDDIALLPLCMHVAPKGTFMKWMSKRGALGGQNKVPRLSNSRNYLETLLALM